MAVHGQRRPQRAQPRRRAGHARDAQRLRQVDAGPLVADPLEQRRLAPLVHEVALLAPLAVQAAPCQLALARFAPVAARLDGRVLERRRAQRHVVAAAQQQVQHLRVEQTLHRLAVDVRDQVSGVEAGLERRATLVYSLQQKGTRRFLLM